jgi:hypothetical protein
MKPLKSATHLLRGKEKVTKNTRQRASGFPDRQLRRRGFVGDKRQLQVVDDAIHHGIVGEESDESLVLA